MPNTLTIFLNQASYEKTVPYCLDTTEGVTYEGEIYNIREADWISELWNAELHFIQG